MFGLRVSCTVLSRDPPRRDCVEYIPWNPSRIRRPTLYSSRTPVMSRLLSTLLRGGNKAFTLGELEGMGWASHRLCGESMLPGLQTDSQVGDAAACFPHDRYADAALCIETSLPSGPRVVITSNGVSVLTRQTW